MQEYLLNIIQPVGDPPPPDVLARIMHDVDGVREAAKKANVWVFTAALTPPGSATVVRTRGEEVLITDGPFVEGKEFIGGFMIVRVADLDAALSWAERLGRAVTLPIEVRPLKSRG